MKVYRVTKKGVVRYFDLTYDSRSLRSAIMRYFGYDADYRVVNILNVRRYCIEEFCYQ